MTTQTDTRNEILDYMLCDAAPGISYWASRMIVEDNKITVTDGEDNITYRFTKAKFLTAARNWAKNNRTRDHSYYRHAAQDILAARWDELDYDADIADQIVQTAIFGKIIYG